MNILRLSAAAAVIGAGLLAGSPAFAWGDGPGYRRAPAYGYEYGPPRFAPRHHWRRWHHRRDWDGPPPGYYRRGW